MKWGKLHGQLFFWVFREWLLPLAYILQASWAVLGLGPWVRANLALNHCCSSAMRLESGGPVPNSAAPKLSSSQTSLSSACYVWFLGTSGTQPHPTYIFLPLGHVICWRGKEMDNTAIQLEHLLMAEGVTGRRHLSAGFGWSCAEEGQNPRQRSQEVSLSTPLLEGRITHVWAALDSCLYNLFFKTSNDGDFTVSRGGLFGHLTTLKTRKFFINILCCKLSRFKKISMTMLLRPKAQLSQHPLHNSGQ